ncbi:class I SAM-dependent methyltransferase [Pseudoalteromonas sp. OOF1S-7]|uniref:class I SAM-dependent methyltransferase n=1 Tax=Pseudoalteromonas sp. OOF1S-7 TaxID=2917757 RepID=UPI001EF58636|nr:class I SAM-dependent methyltransferase [Pseudoalteromonas sp. OOF1S-7]MCG7537124.1 class I SAM-dependent methyltransferase [Pseudoalteromonas sp. OOF1S-7]
MNKSEKQSKFSAYKNIIQYHGVINGVRRIVDQFCQNDWYDIKNGTNFSQILSGDQYHGSLESKNSAVMHYQPVYTAAIKKPLQDMVKNQPVVGASSTCFVDLGCGRGKALHIAKSTLQHIIPIGIELNEELLEDAKKNLASVRSYQKDSHSVFVNANVNDVDYNDLLADFDVVIVFNKNSFDKATTDNTLRKIIEASKGKSLFYIYSNPVFEDLFVQHQCVFTMKGWHKNWNTKVFKINEQEL